MKSQVWDWEAEARRAGARSDGTFNAGLMELPNRALVWQRAAGPVEVFTGEQLHRRAAEMAAVLAHLGVRRGDRVAGLMGRRPAGLCAALATWRLGAVYVPLFSGFGGEALRIRLEDSDPKVVFTDAANRQALGTIQDSFSGLSVIVVGSAGEPGDFALDAMLKHPRVTPEAVETNLHETATIMYTSGTTGRPKGCRMPHRAIITLLPYVKHCLAVSKGDLLFSGADAGWSFGLLTTGLAPMSVGVSRLMYEGPFSAEGWWSCVRDVRPTHLAAAPTAFRQLALAGEDLLPPVLPEMTSAGEPLDAPTFEWFRDATGRSVYDSYGLSELGMVIANLRDSGAPAPVPGSMGRPVPGFKVSLRDENGRPVNNGEIGRIAVKDNSFFLSAGYWGREEEWLSRFEDGWFLTEDMARQDGDGTYRYVGRSDDVIVTAGYNVGPVEVETALRSHPLVLDAACVGEADPRKGQVVAAYVVLRGGAVPDDLLKQLREWVGARMGWHAAPRHVRVLEDLPRTDSGKVQRRRLHLESPAETPASHGQQGTHEHSEST